MRFRRLTNEELQELEKEFIQYLVANGITADDWVKMKENKPKRAEGIIEVFSDIVMEKVLGKIEYLEKREKSSVLFFKIGKEDMVLIGLSTTSNLDFTNEDDIKRAMHQPELRENVEVFKAQKKFQVTREDDMFDLIKSGALITDEKMFTTLTDMIK